MNILYFNGKRGGRVRASEQVCVCARPSDTHFPRGRPVVFIKFSKGSLTQKRFRRLQSSALKGAFVSVKLAKFQPKVGQSD